MNLLIQKSNNKTSNVVKLEMLSTEFSSVSKQIKENEIPVIVFTDTNESFLINNINELVKNSRTTTDVLFNISSEDLISLGGGSSEPVTPSYKVYTALLTQSGTNAPVATVLENTLGGDVVWTRGAVGYYIATSVGLFTNNKTSVQHCLNRTTNSANFLAFFVSDSDTIEMNSTDDLTVVKEAEMTIPSFIEIRVYN